MPAAVLGPSVVPPLTASASSLSHRTERAFSTAVGKMNRYEIFMSFTVKVVKLVNKGIKLPNLTHCVVTVSLQNNVHYKI